MSKSRASMSGLRTTGTAYSKSPKFSSTKGGHVIRNREMVGTLTSTTTGVFSPLGSSALTPGYDINPGNELLFPWLSIQALGWEKYRFKSLSFEVRPGNPSTISGRIYAMVDYDYDDAVPSSPIQMAQSYGLISSDVWQPFVLSVDMQKLNSDMPQRFITNNTRSEVEPRTAYAGYLFLATNGCTTACVFDLFVQYEVELFTPQAVSDPPSLQLVSRTVPLASAPVTYAVGIQPTASGRVCISGSTGVPTLIKDGTSWAGMGVIDLRDCLAGALEWYMGLTANAGTPKVTAPGTGVQGAFFDKDGAFLGWLTQYASGFPFYSTFTYAWDTVGGGLSALGVVNLAVVRAAIPTVSYLAMAVGNSIAKAGEPANMLNGSIRFLSRLI